ncbi:MAG: ABC transporter ATP-binding protein [Chloroflexota bacterium]|nr:ABC transporter ATP-binding protein [Chloroflexota bacterium]
MARVLLQDVTKKYGSTVAVSEISLLVRDGEFLVLVGPSGCGKTSVLRMVAGLEKVTSGEIFIGEQLATDLSPRERNVAMVFESPTFGLYPHLTSRENMAFSLRLRGRETKPPGADKRGLGETTGADRPATGHEPRRRKARPLDEGAISDRIEAVARRLHLGSLMQRRPRQLSSGQNQSLALGRSLVQKPDLFLMDDPLSQVDAGNRSSARVEMRRQHRVHGTTTIYVTHDQQDATALGDRIAVMNQGKLQQVGTARALYAHPENIFVAGFIGSPPMNLLPVGMETDGEETFLRGMGFRVRVPAPIANRLAHREESPILLGLRPEAISNAQYAAHPDPQALVEGQVTAREYTGEKVFLRIKIGGQEIVARVDERGNAWPPDRITLAFDMEQMYAFDPRTEQALL